MKLPFGRRNKNEELDAEIGAHLEASIRERMERGATRAEAEAAARREFGNVALVKDTTRDVWGWTWIEHLGQDLRFGVRMMRKYPGLTLVGVVGMAVAIAIAAGAFGIIETVLDPVLPLDEPDRLVAIQIWDTKAQNTERRVLHDFAMWREELRSIEDLSAFYHVRRNLIVPGAQPEVISVAEMTASGFRAARVRPLLGRTLLPEDEREGAQPVVVIGYNAWRTRFASDPSIIGSTIQLGDTFHTVVGVMPDGFEFPVIDQWWIPLGTSLAGLQPLTGPQIFPFGRLAPGATRESAQTELTTLGRRAADAFPETHAQLRPQVVPYTHPPSDLEAPEDALALRSVQYFVVMLLVIVSVNVAILVYARTATRRGEIAIRTALGASRRRIVTQLFLEALVLSAAAAALGLFLTLLGYQELDAALRSARLRFPFWMKFSLSPGLMIYTLALTFVSAAIVGAVPALKATGRRVQNSLQAISAGGASGMQLGRTWTVLIVAQVAIAVALLPVAVFHAWNVTRHGLADPGFPAEEFLAGGLVMDWANPPSVARDQFVREFIARYEHRSAELIRRLKAEPDVADVTFATSYPGLERTVWVEVEGVPLPPASEPEVSGSGTFGHEARYNRVDVDFFDVFDVPILQGRKFNTPDAAPGAAAIIVNRSFAERVLGGTNVLGRRIRYAERSGDAAAEHIEFGRWYEIVGVVSDFPSRAMFLGLADAKLYHASLPGQFYSLNLAVHVRTADPAAFAGRLGEIAAAIDPNLQIVRAMSLDDRLRAQQQLLRLLAGAIGAVTLSVLLLSSAGIYALMSFTVAQRRKEIAIRAALGANPRHIWRSVFSRALRQLAIGASIGAAAAVALDRMTGGELMGNTHIILPVVAVIMLIVGLLAALGPVRRAARVDPMATLRHE